MVKVTIIGGGIAGSTLANLLKRSHFDVTLIEKDSIGGLLKSIKFDNSCYCDYGPHILFLEKHNDEHIKKFLTSFTNLKSIKPYARTYPTGKLTDSHYYPFSYQNIYKWADHEKIKEEINKAPKVNNLKSFEDYIISQIGKTLYERYFHNYTKKFWGVEPSSIIGDWYNKKIRFPENEEPFFGNFETYYPAKKYSEILQDMVKDCDIIYDEVCGIVAKQDKLIDVKTKSGEVLDGDVFVSTIDPSAFVNVPNLKLRYRSMVVAGVLVRFKNPQKMFESNINWGYFPNHYLFTRITDYNFINAIPDDEHILTFEFPCFKTDDIWSKGVNWFKRYVESFFEKQSITCNILEIKLQKIEKAYPLPVHEEIDKYRKIQKLLKRYNNMFHIGRAGTYQYIWMKDIINQAFQVATDINRRLT